jgi:hypothetical protein
MEGWLAVMQLVVIFSIGSAVVFPMQKQVSSVMVLACT